MMSAAGTPSSDPWVILTKERLRYEEQFRSLKPTNGIVTGEQAKGFFLLSQLPPSTLDQIWSLADTDADGKMDINEFSIACKLINLKLRGYEVPKMVPPTLLASLKAVSSLVQSASLVNQPKVPPVIPPQPLIQPQIPGVTPIIPPMPQAVSPIPTMPLIRPNIPPVATVLPSVQPTLPTVPVQPLIGQTIPIQPVVPNQASTAPLISDILSTSSISNTSLSGISLMGPSVLQGAPSVPVGNFVEPIPTVPAVSAVARASITSLERKPSMDSTQMEWAIPQPSKLKYTQIFNTTDKTRSGFLSGAQARNLMVLSKLPQNILAQIWTLADMDSDGRLGCEEFVLAMYLCEQATQGQPVPVKLPPDLIPPSFRRTVRSSSRTASVSSQGSSAQQDVDSLLVNQTSFEDKRKENFEKGQAELERRRKALLDQQRKEAEERERKEREEIEKRERAKQEAERKRLEELEKQMREQQELERQKEEERKRQLELKEQARKEMERQRQLEWEKQRLQELQQQRQREQENVLKLKAKNQSLTIELSTLNEQVKDLSQKIYDTRLGVTNVKSTIDGMRTTRDTQMQEMSQLKNKLKEQNAKLVALSQEKQKLDAKNKQNLQNNSQDALGFASKEIIIKNLKEKVLDMKSQVETKQSDIENNNSTLKNLRTHLNTLIENCETLYNQYEEKKSQIIEIKNINRAPSYGSDWKESSWNNNTATSNWGGDSWKTNQSSVGSFDSQPASLDVVKYRALYEFVARNNDEISFQPGDIINVPNNQNGEPGWLAGEIRGHTGWFPESYAEKIDGGGEPAVTGFSDGLTEYRDTKPLEGISEVPESVEMPTEVIDYYVATYAYQSQEPGDLSFNAGDSIGVIKKEGEWWTGKLNDLVGIFPSNYVHKVDTAPNSATSITSESASTVVETTAATAAAAESAQADSEVSQINESTRSDMTSENRSEISSAMSNSQTMVKTKKPEIASVIAPYTATSSEQLSLARGQLIMIRKKTDSGWWEGELQAKGRKRQVGWFPASYVKVLNSSGRISGRTTPVSTTKMQQEVIIDKVIALYPYKAGNPDELTFEKDDIISVTAREEEAWWRGELNGISGLFPSNYVTPLQQQ